MANVLLLVLAAVVAGALVFGVAALVTGQDAGLTPAEPDGQSVPLPGTRPLTESDLARVRFDTALRGYRMAQVDAALRRASYDLGFKEELIKVLEAEVDALRSGRADEAESLRQAREAAFSGVTPAAPAQPAVAAAVPAEDVEPADAEPADAEPEVEILDSAAPTPAAQAAVPDQAQPRADGGRPEPAAARGVGTAGTDKS